jgi:hypothetical protein
MTEKINHPSHYARTGLEPIAVIEDWCLDFHLGNALKYIARAGHKEELITDLKKARWCVERRRNWDDGRSYRHELSEAKWRRGRTDQDMSYILKTWALPRTLEVAVVAILSASQCPNYGTFITHLERALTAIDEAIADNS